MKRFSPVEVPHQTLLAPPAGAVAFGATPAGAPARSVINQAGSALPARKWTRTTPFSAPPGTFSFLMPTATLATTPGVWAFGFLIHATSNASPQQTVTLDVRAPTASVAWMTMVLSIEDDTDESFHTYVSGWLGGRLTNMTSGTTYVWSFEGLAEFSTPGNVAAVINNPSTNTHTVTVLANSSGYLIPIS